MRRPTLRAGLALLVLGCGGTPNHDGAIDASPPTADSPAADTPRADSPAADAAAPPDAPIDASPDAAIVIPDGCPRRTAGRGLPQHPYAPAETSPTSVTISSPADLALLNGIKMITGDLTIRGAVGSITLPDLEVVTGRLGVTGDATTELHLPRLETVGYSLTVFRDGPFPLNISAVEAPLLESLLSASLRLDQADLPCLRSAKAGVQIIGAKGAGLALPKLVTADVVSIEQFDAAAFETPALQHGAIKIVSGAVTTIQAGNPDRMSIENDAPAVATIALTSASNLIEFSAIGGQLHDVDFLAGAPRLARFSLLGSSALASVAGLASSPIDDLFIRDTPALVDFSPLRHAPLRTALAITFTGATQLAFLDATVIANAFEIADNPALTSLAMPGLARLDGFGRVAISNNATLPTCQATAIRDQVIVTRTTSTFEITGNLADSCKRP